MPNIKSAKKRVLIIDKKTAQNRKVKKEYKESVKAFTVAKDAGEKDVQELYTKAISSIDKAWSKGVLAKNTAARKKANLAKYLVK